MNARGSDVRTKHMCPRVLIINGRLSICENGAFLNVFCSIQSLIGTSSLIKWHTKIILCYTVQPEIFEGSNFRGFRG